MFWFDVVRGSGTFFLRSPHSKGVLQIDISPAFNTIPAAQFWSNAKLTFLWHFGGRSGHFVNLGHSSQKTTPFHPRAACNRVTAWDLFLFAVGLHQVLKDLPADITNNYYLDGGLHHGALTGLDKLLGWLQPKLQANDLSLNVAKCHIFTRGNTSLFSNLREVPVSADGFEFLGAPIE